MDSRKHIKCVLAGEEAARRHSAKRVSLSPAQAKKQQSVLLALKSYKKPHVHNNDSDLMKAKASVDRTSALAALEAIEQKRLSALKASMKQDVLAVQDKKHSGEDLQIEADALHAGIVMQTENDYAIAACLQEDEDFLLAQQLQAQFDADYARSLAGL